MGNLSVNCKNGTFDIDEEKLAFLRMYKGVGTEDDLKTIFHNSQVSFFTGSSLNYSNINLFLNFLNNPSGVSIENLNIRGIDEMVEMVKAFVDVSCDYALNNGDIQGALYRYEDFRNIDGYKNDSLTSLKSTSGKPGTAKFTFGNKDTVSLKYMTYGFCPYLKIDDVLGNGFFSNEDEYIFPPFIHCELTDNYEFDNRNMDYYRVVNVKDDFLDDDSQKLDESRQVYNAIKDQFEYLFSNDAQKGSVSEELVELTGIVNQYLKSYARSKYAEYNKYYQEKYSNKEDKITTFWGDDYKGIEEAIVQYFTNTDSNRSWAKNDTIHVLALDDLVNSGFIPLSILPQLYASNTSETLERFLKNRNDDSGFRSLTNEEYHDLITNFNIAAGYGDKGYFPVVVEKKIEACNQIVCMDYTESKVESFK